MLLLLLLFLGVVVVLRLEPGPEPELGPEDDVDDALDAALLFEAEKIEAETAVGRGTP